MLLTTKLKAQKEINKRGERGAVQRAEAVREERNQSITVQLDSMVSESLVGHRETCRVSPKHVRDIMVFCKVKITSFLTEKISASERIHGPPLSFSWFGDRKRLEHETLKTRLCDYTVNVQSRFRPQWIDTIEKEGVIRRWECRLIF